MSDERLCGVGLNDLYRDANGQVWEVIGIITSPVVHIRTVSGDQDEHLVIGAPNYQEFEHLVPVSDLAATAVSAVPR